MDEKEVLTTDELLEEMPGIPEYDPEEWDRKRAAEWEAKLAPFKELRAQINEHDELMAETLYEVTMIELGEMEV